MNNVTEKFKVIKDKSFEIFGKEVTIKENPPLEKFDRTVYILKIIVVERRPEVKE